MFCNPGPRKISGRYFCRQTDDGSQGKESRCSTTNSFSFRMIKFFTKFLQGDINFKKFFFGEEYHAKRALFPPRHLFFFAVQQLLRNNQPLSFFPPFFLSFSLFFSPLFIPPIATIHTVEALLASLKLEKGHARISLVSRPTTVPSLQLFTPLCYRSRALIYLNSTKKKGRKGKKKSSRLFSSSSSIPKKYLKIVKIVA